MQNKLKSRNSGYCKQITCLSECRCSCCCWGGG